MSPWSPAPSRICERINPRSSSACFLVALVMKFGEVAMSVPFLPDLPGAGSSPIHANDDGRSPGSPGSRGVLGSVLCYRSACVLPSGGHSVRFDRDEGGLQVPWYLLLNGTEPKWRLHDTVNSTDLEKSLARVMDKGVITYTLASRNEGETFQSLTINGKHLVTYVLAEEADPDPAKTRSRYQAAGF